jgi:4-amino-4-deoxychorismate lyase
MSPGSLRGELIDGEAGAALSADNRGLAYGDGIFRTLRVHAGIVLHFDEQLQALQCDAARLDLEMPEAMLWHAESSAMAAGLDDAVLKWMLVRRSDGRGYRATTRAAHRIVQIMPATRDRPASAAAAICSMPLATQPALAGIKHLNRLEQVLAARELRSGIDELLMCDDRGQLVGGLRSNLFWVRDNQLLTPCVDRCGVAGMMRGQVLRLAAKIGLACHQVRCAAPALASADECFVTNALVGIWPLNRIEARVLPAPGPLTARLMRELGPPFLI